MKVESLFLEFSADKLNQLTARIEACLGSLSEEQIWSRSGERENAIGNLVLHLTGNVRQWIVAALGGQAFARDRDSEFSARGGRPIAEIMAALRETVGNAVQVIADLDTDHLTRTYEIQKRRVSGVEAVYHVVEHFAEHTGQIIFATKRMSGRDLNFYPHLQSAGSTEQVP